MSAHLYERKLSYFSVPKCACTSLKIFFFEVENGFEFRDFRASGRYMHVHNAVYPSRDFEAYPHDRIGGHWKIAVVRDPLERFLSGYSNRVLYHNSLDCVELTEADVQDGMRRRPDLSTFVAHIRRYSKLSSTIAHHTRPMVDYLGRDAGYFDRIYTMDSLSNLVGDVAERVGAVPELKKLQRGGPKFSVTDLSAAEQATLRQYYAEDYEVFGGFLGQSARGVPANDAATG